MSPLSPLLACFRFDPGIPSFPDQPGHPQPSSALLRKRDEQIADAFDDPRRSRMVIQLASICALDLLASGELERFTSQARARVDFITKELTR